MRTCCSERLKVKHVERSAVEREGGIRAESGTMSGENEVEGLPRGVKVPS